MRLTLYRIVTLLSISFFGVTFAHAQGVDAYFGVGTASVNSNNQAVDTFGDGVLYNTPAMSGAFGKAGADFFLNKWLGVGAETDFRFSQANYAGLKYRPTFYDFNAVVHVPLPSRRVVPELQAGLGGVNMKFYYPQSYCDAFAGCSTSNTFVESSNHLQVHMSAGIRFYVTNHVFFRPQVDAHYVNNFFQFGSPWVTEYGASLGYSFGER
jgi:outer membrane protein W